jgi:hypothetical protein
VVEARLLGMDPKYIERMPNYQLRNVLYMCEGHFAHTFGSAERLNSWLFGYTAGQRKVRNKPTRVQDDNT